MLALASACRSAMRCSREEIFCASGGRLVVRAMGMQLRLEETDLRQIVACRIYLGL